MTTADAKTDLQLESNRRRVRARRGQGERLRDELLDAAEQLLVEKADAEAVSIRSVAEIVGVTAPSIYRHFQDKDALVLAACERAYDRFDNYLEAAAANAPDPLHDIKARAVAYVRWALDNPGQYRVLFMVPGSHQHEDFTDAHSFDPDHTEIRGLVRLAESIRAAVADGFIRPVGDVMSMSVMLWSMVHGIASLRIAHPDMPWEPIEVTVDQLFDVLTVGLCTDGIRRMLVGEAGDGADRPIPPARPRRGSNRAT